MAKVFFFIYSTQSEHNLLMAASVDQLVPRLNHFLDQSILLQLVDRTASQRGVDLKTIGDNGSGDELVGWDVLYHLVVQLLVIDNDLLDVLLHLGLRPLLLLPTLRATLRGSLGLAGRSRGLSFSLGFRSSFRHCLEK